MIIKKGRTIIVLFKLVFFPFFEILLFSRLMKIMSFIYKIVIIKLNKGIKNENKKNVKIQIPNEYSF